MNTLAILHATLYKSRGKRTGHIVLWQVDIELSRADFPMNVNVN